MPMRGKLPQAALAQVGLTPRIAHYPKRNCSGGEQQRAAIARAFVTHPAVLFADELHRQSGQIRSRRDNASRICCSTWNRSTGSTLVLVTHDRVLAGRCNRVLELDAGHTVA